MTLRADMAILALCQLSRRRRSVSSPGFPALCGCPGDSGAVRRCPALSGAVPAIQTLRALQPVRSLDRVSSPTQLKVDRVFFSNPKEMTERRKNDEVFGLYRRKVSKTIVFGKQCEMKTQRTCMYS